MMFRRRSLLNISSGKISHCSSVIVSNYGRGPPDEVDPIIDHCDYAVRKNTDL